ncbi:MAG: hypothetical protein AAFZ02_11785 [Pseudomonadota bacterium]
MTITLPSPAERSVLTACVAVGATGALLACEALRPIAGDDGFFTGSAGLWYATLSAGFSATAVAYGVRRNFGHPGTGGALWSVFFSIVATCVLGIVAGSFILPVFGTMFGPWFMILAVLKTPLLALPWALSLYGLHLAGKEYVAEQATAFRWTHVPNPRPRKWEGTRPS